MNGKEPTGWSPCFFFRDGSFSILQHEPFCSNFRVSFRHASSMSRLCLGKEKVRTLWHFETIWYPWVTRSLKVRCRWSRKAKRSIDVSPVLSCGLAHCKTSHWFERAYFPSFRDLRKNLVAFHNKEGKTFKVWVENFLLRARLSNSWTRMIIRFRIIRANKTEVLTFESVKLGTTTSGVWRMAHPDSSSNSGFFFLLAPGCFVSFGKLCTQVADRLYVDLRNICLMCTLTGAKAVDLHRSCRHQITNLL